MISKLFGTNSLRIIKNLYNSSLVHAQMHSNFNYNMSGMEVINPMPGLPIFTITNIRENSPAYLAGLKENDQILSLNNNSNNNNSNNSNYKQNNHRCSTFYHINSYCFLPKFQRIR